MEERVYVVVGLGSFGIRVLERLTEASDQIIIIDKDRDTIERYKDLAAKSFICDVQNRDALVRIIPENVDVAVVDVGDCFEAAIVVITTLKELGAKQIIVRADTEERGKILKMVGATKIVYPALEAATKIVPMLVSSSLFSFMSISPSFVLAEIKVPMKFVGKNLIQANLRQENRLNVVAVRKENEEDYNYKDPKEILTEDDVLLIAGTEKDVLLFTGSKIAVRKNTVKQFFKDFMTKIRKV